MKAPEESGPDHQQGLGLKMNVRRVLILQFIFAIGFIAALITGHVGFNMTAGVGLVGSVKAVAFGSALGIANTVLSARSVKRSSQAVLTAPNLAMMPIYAGLLNKLIVVGGGIALGLIGFGLAPIFIVSGYLVGQLAFVLASLRSEK